jgi:hypothetical protein
MNIGKWGLMGLALTVVAALGNSAIAEDNRPSQATLNQMGLGGLVVMSDADAMDVRGMGYRPSRTRSKSSKWGNSSKKSHSSVQVVGNSFATINGKKGGAHSENSYAVQGTHFAAGGNGSAAGVIKTHGRKVSSTTFFATGFSWGAAF